MERLNWKNLDEKYNGEALSPKSIVGMKRKPGYKEAKEEGSYEKASQVIDSLVGDGKDYLQVLENKDAILIPVMGEERTKSKNQLPIALALKLSELGGMQVNMGVYYTKEFRLTGATQENRLLSPLPEWHGEIQKGKNYIIVDDVLTSGVTINSLKDYVEDMGGKVTAVATLASSRYGKSLGISEDQVEKIRRVDHDECHGKLEQYFKTRYNSGLNGLSHNEANIVLGNATIRKNITLAVAYHKYLEDKKENAVEYSADKGLMWEDRVIIANEILVENEKRLNDIFSTKAGKREHLELNMEGENAKIRVPFFICKEAREVLKDYVQRLNGTYENIRQQDATGRWQTTALIEFNEKSQIPPEICAMIIMGNKPEDVMVKLRQKQQEAREKRVQEMEKLSPEKATSKVKKTTKTKKPEEKKKDSCQMVEYYEDVKSKHPDATVMFRVGDFYAVIGEDAKKTLDVLGRENLQEINFEGMKWKDGQPLKGETIHQEKLDKMLPDLVKAGMRIAICDMPSQPTKSTKKAEKINSKKKGMKI